MAHVISYDFGLRAPETGWLARARKVLADVRAYRATVRELEALTDRELGDLNVARFAIRDIAREAVYGR